MFEANREHKDTMARMEHKFFEEKVRARIHRQAYFPIHSQFLEEAYNLT